ncbi:serine hydrolase domain-containing protein [Ideonella sp. BN130291]|uniref:serine hydrolase domain-containing protein n=1 Tax=Ideonella sp. BN130291 TaxID=3112940 RepID=UPI002E259AA3|nr:serine hydrolase [Ideonella sp. BN130291]
MRTALTFLTAGAAAALSGCAALQADKAVRVATGLTSELVCSGTFISGLPPERSFDELVLTMPGMGLVGWALAYQVDRRHREVTASVAGGFTSRAAYREGLGCVLGPGGDTPAALPMPPLPAALVPDIAGPQVVAATPPALAAAVDRAFEAPGQRTRAIVVLHQGRVVAERYAEGIGPDTPLIGFSMTKSVLNALAGLLVRDGRLQLHQPVPLAAWAGGQDARHAITPDQLLRQVSGLDMPQANSGFDITAQIMFTEPDTAAAAARLPLAAAPGTRWNYSDGHYQLLSRVLRDAAGGGRADLPAYAARELFGPLGMRHASFNTDASGTPVGAFGLQASARDWARFGQLYLADGMAGGRRLLPAGWVRYSTTPTLDTGYGAGWWLNPPGEVPGWGIPWGLPHAPRDTFFARGYRGQFTIVVPSRQLVIVCLAAADMTPLHVAVADRLVADVLAALQP